MRRIVAELNARYDEVEADTSPHAQGMATAYDIAEQIVEAAFAEGKIDLEGSHSLESMSGWEYATTFCAATDGWVQEPEGEGWEENTDREGGYSASVFQHEHYWRRPAA